jgi:hypothetical protein
MDIERLEALLATLREAAIVQGAQIRAELDAIRQHMHDRRQLPAVGAMLEAIARGKRFRLAGYGSFDQLLRTELGISRVTAHRWRKAAKALDADTIRELGVVAAYERAQRAERPTRAKRAKPAERGAAARSPRKVHAAPDAAAVAEAQQLLARLRRRGLRGASVAVVMRGGEAFVRLDMPAAALRRVRL